MTAIHFIGIGGSGMSGLAKYCLSQGHKITGSDVAQNPVITSLKSLGIEVAANHDSSLLRHADTVVYSSAISQDNLELQLAKDLKKKLLHRSEFLASLTVGKKCLAVAGSHGKTTTSAMIVFVLEKLGLKPSAILGGQMRFNGEHFLAGTGDLFVVEADESDGSFLNYAPFASIVTNIGLDHLDHHHSLDGLKDSFLKFINNTHKDGGAILGWDSLPCREIAESYTGRILSFGTKLGCDVRALSLKTGSQKLIFDIMIERDRYQFELPLIGTHNGLNALAALSLFRLLNLDIPACIAALKEFPGVDRRLNTILQTPSLVVLDDYAHNPDKISACVETIRQNWPGWRVHVAFQPHRFSRLMTTWNETCASFKHADYLYLFPVYAAGEIQPDHYSAEKLVTDLQKESHCEVLKIDSFDKITQVFNNNRSNKDIFLTIGAGDIHTVAKAIGEHFGKEEKS